MPIWIYGIKVSTIKQVKEGMLKNEVVVVLRHLFTIKLIHELWFVHDIVWEGAWLGHNEWVCTQ
jgi:hypothetical protein